MAYSISFPLRLLAVSYFSFESQWIEYTCEGREKRGRTYNFTFSLIRLDCLLSRTSTTPQLSSLLPVTCPTQPDWISNTYPPLPPPPPPRTKCMHFTNIYTIFCINRKCMKFKTTVCYREVSKILAAYFDFYLKSHCPD